MTDLWHNNNIDLGKGAELATGHLLKLPDHQHVEVEASFLSSHVPFHVGGIGGVNADGEPWLFIVQKAPMAYTAGSSNPSAYLREDLDRAVSFNLEALPWLERYWTHQDLVQIYTNQGGEEDTRFWPVADLLRGLLAECCGFSLPHLVTCYAGRCAFPNQDHPCQHDVFNDVFAAWAQRRLPPADHLGPPPTV